MENAEVIAVLLYEIKEINLFFLRPKWPKLHGLITFFPHLQCQNKTKKNSMKRESWLVHFLVSWEFFWVTYNDNLNIKNGNYDNGYNNNARSVICFLYRRFHSIEQLNLFGKYRKGGRGVDQYFQFELKFVFCNWSYNIYPRSVRYTLKKTGFKLMSYY